MNPEKPNPEKPTDTLYATLAKRAERKLDARIAEIVARVRGLVEEYGLLMHTIGPVRPASAETVHHHIWAVLSTVRDAALPRCIESEVTQFIAKVDKLDEEVTELVRESRSAE